MRSYNVKGYISSITNLKLIPISYSYESFIYVESEWSLRKGRILGAMMKWMKFRKGENIGNYDEVNEV